MSKSVIYVYIYVLRIPYIIPTTDVSRPLDLRHQFIILLLLLFAHLRRGRLRREEHLLLLVGHESDVAEATGGDVALAQVGLKLLVLVADKVGVVLLVELQ